MYNNRLRYSTERGILCDIIVQRFPVSRRLRQRVSFHLETVLVRRVRHVHRDAVGSDERERTLHVHYETVPALVRHQRSLFRLSRPVGYRIAETKPKTYYPSSLTDRINRCQGQNANHLKIQLAMPRNRTVFLVFKLC